jgi:hypothetical protein
MPRRLPCPNPACTQVFDPEAVAGAASLVCPRCGTRFQFRAAAPAARPAVPVAEPVGAESEPPDFAFNADPVSVSPAARRRKPRPSSRAPLVVVLAAFAVFLGLTAVGLVWYYSSSDGGDEDNPMPAQSNCRFRLPGRAWKPHDEARDGLGANLALRRSRPSSAMALSYRDYKTRQPRDEELKQEALARLRSYFRPQGLEWELRPKSDEDRLGGQPALRLDFKGIDPNEVEVSGECFITAYRGIGYWFVTWGPSNDRDQLGPEWESLRRGFALLDQREGWKEAGPEAEVVEGTEVPYRLSAARAVWRKEKKEGYDPRAEVVLLGRAATGPRHAGTDATVQVLVLPKADDLKSAVKAATDHYLGRQKEDYPETTLEVFKDRNGADEDRDTEVGAAPGHVTKLRVTNEENRERYVVLAVVPGHSGGDVVLVCDCAWPQRDRWDPEFAALLKTFRFKE